MPDEEMNALDAAYAETSRQSRELMEKGRQLAEKFEATKAAAAELRKQHGIDDEKMARFFASLSPEARARVEEEEERVRSIIRQAKEDARRAMGADAPKPAAGKKRPRNMA